MDNVESSLKAEWLDRTSNKIMRDLGILYKRHTNYLADTDTNLIYHALLIETIFYKLFVSILESVADDGKDSQMEEMIDNMRKFRKRVRDEDEMWLRIQEQQA